MTEGHPGAGAAFLLAQLGGLAAGQFAERVARLDLTPPQAGILRLVSRQDGISQRRLGAMLGVSPSKMVALLDELERRGLITRIRSAEDRRVHLLSLTAAGQVTMRALRKVAREHEAELTAPLTVAQRATLTDLLARLAHQHGMTPGVHPGYRNLDRPE